MGGILFGHKQLSPNVHFHILLEAIRSSDSLAKAIFRTRKKPPVKWDLFRRVVVHLESFSHSESWRVGTVFSYTAVMKPLV